MSAHIVPATQDDLINASIIENLKNDNYDLSFQNLLLAKENDELKDAIHKLINQNNELKKLCQDAIDNRTKQNEESKKTLEILKTLNNIFPEKKDY